MKNTLVLFIILFFALCCKEKNDQIVKSDMQYVRLVSKEKKEWVLQFYCLNSVTQASPTDENLGLEDRMAILNGRRVLSNYTIEHLDCGPIFELPLSMDSYQYFIDSVKNNDSVNINSLSFPLNGIYINELINRGYIITFSDYEGSFFIRGKQEKQ
jgi:hypothetical protein